MPDKPGAARNLLVAFLLVTVVLGIVSFVMLYSGIPLCINCPTTVQYNPSGSTHTLKTLSLSPSGASTGLSTQTLSGGPASWPIGSAGTSFTINGPLGPFGSWLVALPADSSVGASSSYVFSSTYSGTAFLSAANNAGLWNSESGSMNGQNPVVFNNTFTSTVGAPSACNTASTNNVCKVTWYLNRYYFTVDMKTAGAGLYVACLTTCAGYSSFFGVGSNKAQYDAAFQSGFQTVYSQVNQVMHLSTGSTLSLQLNVPPLPGGQSNVDVAGVLAAWTATPCSGGSATPAGGGSPTGDLCTTNCGPPAGCSIVQSAVHTPLSLFSDSAMTQKYLPSCLTNINAPGYTASQLAGVCGSSLSSSVYAKLDLSDFGAGFSQPSSPTFSNCGISSFGSCWSVNQPEAVLTVLLDVLTSNHVYQQYSTPPPMTGTGAGGFDGQVVDGSLFWKPGVPGASVCLQPPATGCYPVNTGGYFNASNVASGQYSLQVTAPGFYSSSPFSISVGTGTTHYGQISLAELNPWYSGNLCISGTQGFLGLSAGICIPWLAIFTLAAIVTIIAIAYITVYSRPANTIADVARRLTPNNPLSPSAQGFVARRIAFYLKEGEPAKVAQARAFSDARQRGYHVPPPPKLR